MKITLQFLLLCLLILLLTGCPEPELIIDYVYGISVKLDIMNNSTQEQNITFHGVQHSYADPGTWGMSFDDTGKEVHEVSSTVQGGDTATLDGKSSLNWPERFSFYVEIGGECYLGWSKLEPLHDKYGKEMKLSVAKDNLGVATISQQGEGVRTQWEGPTPSATSSPSDKTCPTARYTVTITDGPDGTPQAEFTLVELSY